MLHLSHRRRYLGQYNILLGEKATSRTVPLSIDGVSQDLENWANILYDQDLVPGDVSKLLGISTRGLSSRISN